MMNKNRKIRAFVSDKSYPIPVEMRPLWRICFIIISIIEVSGDKKYLEAKKLNILVWMLIRKTRWDEYEEYLLGRTREIPLVSVDTATYKAVEYAVAKELITLKLGRVYVSDIGYEFFRLLVDNEIMKEERDFLQTNGRKLTNNKVKGLTGGIL